MNSLPYLFLYLFFGLTPSFIWLLFFLRKDSHPEPKIMVLKIFVCGMLMAPIAALIEFGIIYTLFENSTEAILNFWYSLLGVALVEEVLKYLVVREIVLKSPEFDEPVDAMLYMIIAALGFAAVENVLFLLPEPEKGVFLFSYIFQRTLFISIIRFLGATFLHALCSGSIGFFLALSLSNIKKQEKLIILGLSLGILLHALFNVSIIKASESQSWLFLLLTAGILIGLAIFVSFGFRKLKKITSVCKIK